MRKKNGEKKWGKKRWKKKVEKNGGKKAHLEVLGNGLAIARLPGLGDELLQHLLRRVDHAAVEAKLEHS